MVLPDFLGVKMAESQGVTTSLPASRSAVALADRPEGKAWRGFSAFGPQSMSP